MVECHNFAVAGGGKYALYDSETTLAEIALSKGVPINGTLMGPAGLLLIHCIDIQNIIFTKSECTQIICVPFKVEKDSARGVVGALLLGLERECTFTSYQMGLLSLLAAATGVRVGLIYSSILNSVNFFTGACSNDCLCTIPEGSENDEDHDDEREELGTIGRMHCVQGEIESESSDEAACTSLKTPEQGQSMSHGSAPPSQHQKNTASSVPTVPHPGQLCREQKSVEEFSGPDVATKATPCHIKPSVNITHIAQRDDLQLTGIFFPEFKSKAAEREFISWIGKRVVCVDITFCILIIFSMFAGGMLGSSETDMIKEPLEAVVCGGIALIPGFFLFSASTYPALRDRLVISVRLCVVGLVNVLALRMYQEGPRWGLPVVGWWCTQALVVVSLTLRLRMKLHCMTQVIAFIFTTMSLSLACQLCYEGPDASACVNFYASLAGVFGCLFPTIGVLLLELKMRRVFATRATDEVEATQR